MTTYRIPQIFLNAFLGATMLCATGYLHADMAVGPKPSENAPLAGKGSAVQHLMDQYKAGAISSEDFAAGIAHLEKNVTLTGTSNGDSAAGNTLKISRLKDGGAPSPSLASHDMAAVQTPSDTASPCPTGWTATAGSNPKGPAFDCEQDCYNSYKKAWVVTTLSKNNDGTGWVNPTNNSIPPSPPYGEIVQDVYFDGGPFSVYDNFFLGSNTDLNTMVAFKAHYGVTNINFQGPAPDPKAGFQLQVIDPPAHSGGDLCSTATPYYCAPQNLTQSPSCQ